MLVHPAARGTRSPRVSASRVLRPGRRSYLLPGQLVSYRFIRRCSRLAGGLPWPMWATSSSEVDMAFYIVTSIVLGGACAYALWYASKRRKQ